MTSPARNLIVRFIGDTSRLEGELNDSAGKMNKAGYAVGAAAAAGIFSAMNIEESTNKLAAQLGLTEQESARIGKSAGKLYRQAYGDSMEEVNQTIGAVISSMDGMRTASVEQLEAVSKNALDFAKIFDIDVTRAVHSAGQAMTNGLARDGQHAFDILMAASQKVPAQLREDVLEAGDEYGEFFAQLGFNGEEAFGTLAAAAQDGQWALDKTGDALKEFTIRSTDMSTASVDAYQKIGLNAEEMAAKILAGGDSAKQATGQIAQGLLDIEDPVERANAAIALFGTPLEDLNVGQIPEFLDNLIATENSLGDVSGKADEAGASFNDNFSTALEQAKREAMGMATDYGQVLLPVLKETQPVLEGVGAAMSAFSTFLQDNGYWIKYVVAAITGPVGWIVAMKMAYDESEVLREIVSTVWNAIGAVVSTVWEGFLKPVFDAMIWYYQTLGSTAMWLWNEIIVPAWTGISSFISVTWNDVLMPIFGFMEQAYRGAGATVMWLWNEVINPAWNGISGTISAVYHGGIKPTFDLLNQAVGAVGSAFEQGVGRVGTAWDRLKGILAGPVNFFVDPVYAKIVEVWNKVTSAVGLGSLNLPPIGKVETSLLGSVGQQFGFIERNQGGPIPGVGDKDTVPALLTPGEFVIKKSVAQRTKNFLAALNSGQAEALQATGGSFARFAGGGLVAAHQFARAQHGKPYIWGGVGPGGYDCSGFMSAITNVLRGQPPHRRLGATGSMPWSGFRPGLGSAFALGHFKGSPGHTAGTLGGVNVEAGGSPSRTKYGAGAAGVGSFRIQHFLPEAGGVFAPGGGGGGFLPDINPVTWLKKQFAGAYDAMKGLAAFPGDWGRIIEKLPETIIDKMIGFLKDKVLGLIGTVGDVGLGLWNAGPGGVISDIRGAPGIRNIPIIGRDQGGPLHPGLSLVHNGTGQDEYVLNPQQMRDYGRVEKHYHLHINNYGDPIDPVARFRQMELMSA